MGFNLLSKIASKETVDNNKTLNDVLSDSRISSKKSNFTNTDVEVAATNSEFEVNQPIGKNPQEFSTDERNVSVICKNKKEEIKEPITDKYNFHKYGDNPYLPELEIRNKKDFFAKPYDSNYKSFCKTLIDDMVRLHKPTSGYIIKLLFDEYQRGMTSSDAYTMFYSGYCISSKGSISAEDQKQFKLSNNNLYVLLFNRWGDLYPKRIIKEYPLVASVLQSLDSSPCDDFDNSKEAEEFARSVAIRLHYKSKDNWDKEIIDGEHDWTQTIHLKYLLAVKDIISYLDEQRR